MALATYSDLLSSVASWMDRTDLSAIIPDFVTLAESRIARDLRLRKQIATTTLTTTAGVQTVTLPDDLLEIENLTVTSNNPPLPMSVITPELMDQRWPAGVFTGAPRYYTVIGDQMSFGPTPDAEYSISVDYYQRIAALSVTPTNWLLTYHPNIYLFAALVEGWSYLMDLDKAAYWQARYSGEIKNLQESDDALLRSGSVMRVKAI